MAMRTRTHVLVSLIGIISGNVLYMNAGVQVDHIQASQGLALPPTDRFARRPQRAFPRAVEKAVSGWRGHVAKSSSDHRG